MVVFLGSLAQFLGLRAKSTEAELAALAAARVEAEEDAGADLDGHVEAAPVASPVRIPTDEESARFAAILEKPSGPDKQA
jgi:hypothetical protein